MREERRVVRTRNGWILEVKRPLITQGRIEERWWTLGFKPFNTKEEANAQLRELEERDIAEEQANKPQPRKTCSWLNPWGVGEITSRLDERTGDWRR